MEEQRHQDYLELVQALINCESGAENDILQAHPELVDRVLVIKLLAMARMMSQENDSAKEPTIQWLNDFASQLAKSLELEISSGSEADRAQLSFLMTVFQAISESNGDPHIIYPLCQDNLYLLNEELASILEAWVQVKFVEVDEEGKYSITLVISEFANLIAQFPLGIRATNLEIAIACYDLAMGIHTREAYPDSWGRIQMNLGVTYKNRIRGERAQNVEAAIACYDFALSVHTREVYPDQWGRIQMNLAIAYKNRIIGEQAVNIEKSIDSYRLALEVHTRNAYPEAWALVQMNLGIAYQIQVRGEQAVNIEKSIDSYRSALEVYTRNAYPEAWALVQMNLGIAYQIRVRGEQLANVEESISCSLSALEVYTTDTYPEQWAAIQENLATLHAKQGRDDLAISHHQRALKIFQPEAFPINAL